MKLLMCRICLVENVVMLPIAKTPLQEIYEKLTEIKLETYTSRPDNVCYMCYARLRKCYYLRNSCLQSEAMFAEMLLGNDPTFPSKPKPSLLTITPFVKMTIADETDEVVSTNEVQIKMEATLTDEIDIKIEKQDISDTEEYSGTDSKDTDVKMKMEDGDNSSTIDNSAAISLETPLHISTTGKRYKCNICNQQFSQNVLVNHLRPHTSEKQNKCNICHKQFSRKSNLVTHLRTHTGEKPYKCDICNKQFTTSSHLVTHLRTHSGEKPYTCDICNKNFSDNSNLMTHLRTHTGEKPYSCDICNKQFTNSSHLVTHLRIHTGEKPYKCDICGKQFTCKSSLVTHLRTHTDEKPYRCNICNKLFATNSCLTRHIRTHTKLS